MDKLSKAHNHDKPSETRNVKQVKSLRSKNITEGEKETSAALKGGRNLASTEVNVTGVSNVMKC